MVAVHGKEHVFKRVEVTVPCRAGIPLILKDDAARNSRDPNDLPCN